MFTYRVSVRNDIERIFNASRIEKIKKLFGDDVKKLEGYIECRNSTNSVTIFPKSFSIESDNINFKDTVRKISNILEFNNIISIECCASSELIENPLDKSVEIMDRICKVDIPFKSFSESMTLNTEFLTMYENEFYMIKVSLVPKGIIIKVTDSLKNIEDIDICTEKISTLLENFINWLINDDEVSTND